MVGERRAAMGARDLGADGEPEFQAPALS